MSFVNDDEVGYAVIVCYLYRLEFPQLHQLQLSSLSCFGTLVLISNDIVADNAKNLGILDRGSPRLETTRCQFLEFSPIC